MARTKATSRKSTGTQVLPRRDPKREAALAAARAWYLKKDAGCKGPDGCRKGCHCGLCGLALHRPAHRPMGKIVFVDEHDGADAWWHGFVDTCPMVQSTCIAMYEERKAERKEETDRGGGGKEEGEEEKVQGSRGREQGDRGPAARTRGRQQAHKKHPGGRPPKAKG